MNLIDFVVTNILSEEEGYMYQLFNITKEKAEQEKNMFWKAYLLSKGIKQILEIEDMGGKNIKTEFINIDAGEKPYKVGDKRLH